VKKVGEITQARSGLTIPIFIEKTTFICDCLETQFTATDAKILEAKVQYFIEHWLTLDWHPVIKVESATASQPISAKRNAASTRDRP
jgi:hypothetical protein